MFVSKELYQELFSKNLQNHNNGSATNLLQINERNSYSPRDMPSDT